MTSNPFLAPAGGILLSLSTCSVIATHVARELRQGVAFDAVAGVDVAGLPDDREVLITAEQVAGLLAVKKSTVFELSRRRLDPLPSISIGRAKRFDRSAVDTWLKRQ